MDQDATASSWQNNVCDAMINADVTFINFNYTEFPETLYKVPTKNILYIHGDRRDGRKDLILGHSRHPDKDYADWYGRNKGHKRFSDYRRGRKGRRYRSDSLSYLTYFNKLVFSKAEPLDFA